jgi:hypothetical protein
VAQRKTGRYWPATQRKPHTRSLRPEQIAQCMMTAPDWQFVSSTAIQRRYAFGSFKEAE